MNADFTRQTARGLRWMSCLFLGLTLMVSPWLFGAWEMWWFWTMMVPFSAAVICGAAAVLLDAGHRIGKECRSPALMWLPGILAALIALYAILRFFQTPVVMVAERSVLLILTPLLIGMLCLYVYQLRQNSILFGILALNSLAQSAYGLINHMITGSKRVMWEPGYPQYLVDDRASGSFFCPNHFAGMLIIGAAIGAAFVMHARQRYWVRIAAGVLFAACATGILMSKSRGGLISLLCVVIMILASASVQWHQHQRMRLLLTGGGAAVVFLSVLFLTPAGRGAVERFRSYWPDRTALAAGVAQENGGKLRATWLQLRQDHSRPVMYEGAFRAWRSSPVLGIGPGMHQVIWPALAAGTDGDIQSGRWPSEPYYHLHSYHVHNDWLQLLEEYGLLGAGLMMLLLIPCSTILAQGIRNEKTIRGQGDAPASRGVPYAIVMAACAAGTAYCVHALVDFNMHIPANNWQIATLVSIAVAAILRTPLTRRTDVT